MSELLRPPPEVEGWEEWYNALREALLISKDCLTRLGSTYDQVTALIENTLSKAATWRIEEGAILLYAQVIVLERELQKDVPDHIKTTRWYKVVLQTLQQALRPTSSQSRS